MDTASNEVVEHMGTKPAATAKAVEQAEPENWVRSRFYNKELRGNDEEHKQWKKVQAVIDLRGDDAEAVAAKLNEDGIPINVTSNTGMSIVSYAAHKGYISLISWLLENGADPLMQDDIGLSAVGKAKQWATQNGPSAVELLEKFTGTKTDDTFPYLARLPGEAQPTDKDIPSGGMLQ